MTWRASVLTLFPEMFPGPLGHSLAGRGLATGLWSLDAVDIRAFATDRHRSVDDAPFGGGAGMVMRPDVVDAALAAALQPVSEGGPVGPAIYLSPRGRVLNQALAEELAAGPGCVLVCGRYEGFDERIFETPARSAEDGTAADEEAEEAEEAPRP